MAELVHLRLDKGLRTQIKEIVSRRHFSSETEFIRESIRKNLETYEKLEALRTLMNSAPKKKQEKISEATTSELFRKYGLDEVPEIR